MSKEFTLNPGDIEYYHANDFIEVTKNSNKYLYKPNKKSAGRYFGYCTGGCDLKVFRSKPTTENGDYFFKHVKGYYTPQEQNRMYSCRYYKPAKGKREQPQPIDIEYLQEIFEFLVNNSYWIYRYINTQILKDIGIMSTDFFINIIKNVFVDNVDKLSTSDRISTRLLPYNILELMFGSGKIEFTNMNYNTINFDSFKKGLPYFDYFIFILTGSNLEKNVLGLEVIQEKNYGKFLDKPITLHSVEIPIDIHGLVKFIDRYKKFEVNNFLLSNEEIKTKYNQNEKQAKMIISNKERYQKITNSINELFH